MARTLLPLLLTVAAACVPASARAPGPGVDEPFAAQIDAILGDTMLAHAHVGIEFVSLRTGETIYRRNAGQLFLPASNQKLITGAAALETLGPGFQFRTDIYASGQIRDGILHGDLIVRGSGDPTFSARFGEDSRSVFRAWADSLRARGISRVQGGIIGVDSAFTGPAVGAGWAWDDLDAGFAAEYGALQFNEGVATLRVVPSSTVGSPPIVVIDPPTQYIRIYPLATTTPAGTPVELSVRREADGPGVTIAGSVPVDTILTTSLAVRDPTVYFLSVMREALREAGIDVQGQAMPADEWPEDRRGVVEALLFTQRSPPLSDVLAGMMKPSQNLIAETLLLTLGRELRGEGSAEAGIAVVDSLLSAWNLPVGEVRMADGSGLSRYDLVSPALLVGILRHMDRSGSREVWRASLPLAGVDGTLSNRMREAPLHENVLAKTGTLSGVRTLSGYLVTQRGEPLAFSFLVDHHLRSGAAVDSVMEAVLRQVITDR